MYAMTSWGTGSLSVIQRLSTSRSVRYRIEVTLQPHMNVCECFSTVAEITDYNIVDCLCST